VSAPNAVRAFVAERRDDEVTRGLRELGADELGDCDVARAARPAPSS
jgi:hypothetical protein